MTSDEVPIVQKERQIWFELTRYEFAQARIDPGTPYIEAEFVCNICFSCGPITCVQKQQNKQNNNKNLSFRIDSHLRNVIPPLVDVV